MDESKKTKKPTNKKQEEESNDVMFNGNSNMLNFGGGAELDGEEFVEKQREQNIIRKYQFDRTP